MDDLKIIKCINLLSSGNENDWKAVEGIIPKDMLLHVSDKGKLKKGNGKHKYEELDTFLDLNNITEVNQVFTTGCCISMPTKIAKKIDLPGWLFCDGSYISKTTYADLYAIVGSTYGERNNKFALPDRQTYSSKTRSNRWWTYPTNADVDISFFIKY